MRTTVKAFLGGIVAVELASLVGFFIPEVREAAFFGVLLIAFVASLQRLEYGLYLLFAELAIGSKGYVLWYAYDGIDVSLRLGLFFVVMCVWLGKLVIDWMSVDEGHDDIDPFLLRGKTWQELPKQVREKVTGAAQHKKPWGVYGWYALLFVMIGWGVFNGYVRGNGARNIFFDANGWLYFGVVFPFAFVLKKRADEARYAERIAAFWKGLVAAAGAGVTWLTAKTLILLYIFSHNLPYAQEVYQWVRVTGVGEITRMENNFVRIFLQSQVWSFFALFGVVAATLWLAKHKRYRALPYCFFGIVGLVSIVVLSLSRSFWAGLGVGVAVYAVMTLFAYGRVWKAWLLHAGIVALAAVASVGLIWGVVAFPFPDPTAHFDVHTLKDRTKDLDDEAAASSRWQLLPVLWGEIREAPLRGKGFGETVTYVSNDPRVREEHASGEFTTTAFEWGWFDVWLKLGIVGVIAYGGLLAYVAYYLLRIVRRRTQDSMRLPAVALLGALAFLAATHAVSPYLNHPLGIGFVVAAAAWVEWVKGMRQ